MRIARALALSLLLLACAPRPAQEGAATPTPPAAQGEFLEVGACLPLTGAAAEFGVATRTGMDLAVERINAEGGVLGRKLRLHYQDTQSRPDEAAQAARKLIAEDRVLCILGETTSASSLVAAQVCQEAKVPMITPSATSPQVTRVGDYIFRVCYTDEFQGEAIARFAAEGLEKTRAALLVDPSSDYSRGVSQAFKRSFEQQGGAIVAEESYTQGDADFAGALDRLKGSDPDVLVVPGFYREAARIATQAQEQGLDVPILGGDGWESPALLELGGEALDGSYFSTHFDPQSKDPAIVAFVEAFRERTDQRPGSLPALGHDAVTVMADAMKRAGRPDPKALRDALAQTRGFPGLTGRITLAPGGDAETAAIIQEIRDGTLVTVTRIAAVPASSN